MSKTVVLKCVVRVFEKYVIGSLEELNPNPLAVVIPPPMTNPSEPRQLGYTNHSVNDLAAAVRLARHR